MNVIVSYIKKRIARNQNFLAATTGGTGSGKSYATISLCFALNGKEPKIYYDLDLFIEDLKEGRLKVGDCIIIDEAGLMVGSRTSMTKANRVISMIAQSFRYMRLVTFFCVPDISFIDIHVRKLIHMHFKTDGINYKEKLCYIRPYSLGIDEMGKIKYSPISVRNKETGDVSPLGRMGICKPPEWYLFKYEQLKDGNVKKQFEQFEQLLKPKKFERYTENPYYKKALNNSS